MEAAFNYQDYDTVVIGGGSSGIAAAAGSAKNGVRTLIIDAGPTLGGELLTGMTIDGAVNANGERIVGGFLNELIEELEMLDGYVGELNDWRLIRYLCIDPVVTQIAIVKILNRYGIDILLNTKAENVVMDKDTIKGIVISNKSGRSIVNANVFIDCSGDGDICALAGAPFEIGSSEGELQPVSMMFRVMGVETVDLLNFVRENPENVAVGESKEIRKGLTDREIVEEIYKQGQPTVFFKGDGPLLSKAIEDGEMFPTALVMIQPTSVLRKEVCINATRVANISGLNTKDISGTMGELFEQISTCVRFLKRNVPGFENAQLAAIAPRIGVRETRRITGEYILTRQDVAEGKKFDDGVAKGCHHIDIHQDGTKQIRIPIANGGSYDIPFRSLIPLKLKNVLVAGRCLSADRDAMGSARVMGSCMAMGEATGTAAAMFSLANLADTREIKVDKLRQQLKDQGAILDGTL